eukprot:6183613-Pleurochrysis_carterae.AAC.3
MSERVTTTAFSSCTEFAETMKIPEEQVSSYSKPVSHLQLTLVVAETTRLAAAIAANSITEVDVPATGTLRQNIAAHMCGTGSDTCSSGNYISLRMT